MAKFKAKVVLNAGNQEPTETEMEVVGDDMEEAIKNVKNTAENTEGAGFFRVNKVERVR